MWWGESFVHPPVDGRHMEYSWDVTGRGDSQILAENPSQCHFAFPHKSHAHCPRIKPRHAWWETGKLTASAMTRPSVVLYWDGTGVEYLRFLSIYMQMNEGTCTQPKGLSYLSSNIRFTSKWRICLSQMQPYCYALVHTLPVKSLRITKSLCLWRDGCICGLLRLSSPLSIPSMIGGWLDDYGTLVVW